MSTKIAEAHGGVVSQSNLGGKQKFNSIDVGHDEGNFNSMNN